MLSPYDHFVSVEKDYPSIWLHVDAAWAGVTLSCPELRDRAQIEGINKYATSLCVNFHKVSPGTSCSRFWITDSFDVSNSGG